jgi:hypothetical protein
MLLRRGSAVPAPARCAGEARGPGPAAAVRQASASGCMLGMATTGALLPLCRPDGPAVRGGGPAPRQQRQQQLRQGRRRGDAVPALPDALVALSESPYRDAWLLGFAIAAAAAW